MPQSPSVAQLVHYVPPGNPQECQAAIIVDIPEPADPIVLAPERLHLLPTETVNLFVMVRVGSFFCPATHNEAKAGGTWHWPERV